METKLDEKSMVRVRNRYDFLYRIEVSAEGTHEGLCTDWKDIIGVTLHSFSKNHVDIVIKDDSCEKE